MIITRETHARMGLVGNPSDGFGGKTITVQIQQFRAVVTLWESPQLEIIPHPRHDPFRFESLAELHRIARTDGYYGGTRLIYASCKRFFEYCRDADIPLRDANFTITYDTDIPRQVGLGGSSAIVVSALRCLMDFHGVTEEHIPLPLQPQLALSVEQDELEIKAGLQDRVAQIYGGLVYMNFDPEYMAEHGHGEYERLPLDLLPDLYLAHMSHSTVTSGKAHNPIHYRFANGDREVIDAMRQFAEYAEEARAALWARDHRRLGELMDANFDLRRKIYGDEAIGAHNLEMVALARSFGLPAKFTGSGGAITGILWPDSPVAQIERAFVERGYRFQRATPIASDAKASVASEQVGVG